jgi:hypothetical protein
MAAAAKWKVAAVGACAFPGIRPEGTVRGIFGDAEARIIGLGWHSNNAMGRLQTPQGTPSSAVPTTDNCWVNGRTTMIVVSSGSFEPLEGGSSTLL